MARALAEFRRAIAPDVSLPDWELEKNIPHGSGLGAGSSDAAAALLLAGRMAGVADRERLAEAAARVGSDCAFFVRGWPAADAAGRGEVLRPLVMRPMHAVIVWPGFSMGTAESYSSLRPEDLGTRSEVEALSKWLASPDGPPPATHNAFERNACHRHPIIAEILGELRASGATVAHLSGSGSACFGLYTGPDGPEEAIARMERLRDRHATAPPWWIQHTIAGGA